MIPGKDIKELLSYKVGDCSVTTLSLNTDARRLPGPKGFMAVFKNLVKQKRAGLHQTKLSPEARQSIEEDFQKMEAYLADQFVRDNQRGVLIYSCSQKGLWLPLAFPIPLQSKLIILSHPYILPLTALLDQYPKYAVVIVGEERARIFEVYLGEVVEHTEIYDELPGKTYDPSSKEYKSPQNYGLAERRFERRNRKSGGVFSGGEYGLAENRIERHLDAHLQRHFKRISEKTFNFFKTHHFESLIVAGQEKTRSEFEATLHDDLKKRIIARIKADPKSPLPALTEESLNMIREAESKQKAQVVDRIVQANRPLGLGVLGVLPTLHALAQGMVQILVVQEGIERSGARCRSCGTLTQEGNGCPECGGQTDPVSDLMEETIEQAISQSAQIIHTPPHPVLEQWGGMAALLRYQPAKNTNIARGAA